MKVQHSPPDSPFPWVAYEGPDLESVPNLPKSAPKERAFYLPSRDIQSPEVSVSVVDEGIRVVARSSRHLVRAVRFEPGFPLGRRLSFPYSDGVQAVIAADGSVVFLAGLDLYLWQFADGQLRRVTTLTREPEAMVISPAVRRLAILASPSRSPTSEWVANVFSLPDGKHLSELRWHSIWGGSLAYCGFSADGGKLVLSTDVCAQSGSDFTDDHTWDIGVGPENTE